MLAVLLLFYIEFLIRARLFTTQFTLGDGQFKIRVDSWSEPALQEHSNHVRSPFPVKNALPGCGNVLLHKALLNEHAENQLQGYHAAS